METVKNFVVAVFTHKRMKSLYWSLGTMAVPVLGDVVVEQLTAIDIPTNVVIFVGLAFAQVTKALNSKTS